MILPPQLLLSVVQAGYAGDDGEEAGAIRTLLRMATAEAVADLTEPTRSKVLRRSKRAYDDVVVRFLRGEPTVGKVGLTIFYALQAIVEADYLVLHDRSAMAEAIDLVLPHLERAAASEALDRSAQKQARQLLRHLGELGYFRQIAAELEAGHGR